MLYSKNAHSNWTQKTTGAIPQLSLHGKPRIVRIYLDEWQNEWPWSDAVANADCLFYKEIFKSSWQTNVLYAILYSTLIAESTTEYLKWNSRQPTKEIAAAPLQCSVCLRNGKKQTLKVSEFQSRYIVSSKIWREIISRWFDVLCTGSFYYCRQWKILQRGLISVLSRCLPIEGQIEDWMTVRMGYDSATTSRKGASGATLRWDSGAGTEKRHSEKTANYLENGSVLHPLFLLLAREAVLRSKPQPFADFPLQKCRTIWALFAALPLRNL